MPQNPHQSKELSVQLGKLPEIKFECDLFNSNSSGQYANPVFPHVHDF